MSTLKEPSIERLVEFAKLRRENRKLYRETLKGIMYVVGDLEELSRRISLREQERESKRYHES